MDSLCATIGGKSGWSDAAAAPPMTSAFPDFKNASFAFWEFLLRRSLLTGFDPSERTASDQFFGEAAQSALPCPLLFLPPSKAGDRHDSLGGQKIPSIGQ